mmetsp:Transcript_12147/g.35674  ORF Transcript_12147/g.35674 Transcript_12147/m.35674 type:complete len:85 (-) Transcript_12147:8-262(-)
MSRPRRSRRRWRRRNSPRRPRKKRKTLLPPVVAAAPLGGGELVTPSDGATAELPAPRSKACEVEAECAGSPCRCLGEDCVKVNY